MRRSISVAAGLFWLAGLSACGKNNGPGGPDNAGPQAQFVFTCEARRCSFNEASTDADGSIISWKWDFGDGTESTEQEPVHEYGTAGNDDVTLTITDDQGATSTKTKTVDPSDPVVTELTCADGGAPGSYVSCTLRLESPSGFKVTLDSHDCRAHGNVFRITAPVESTLFEDGCYATVGSEIVHAGPFPAGTEIAAEVQAPMLTNPPALRVEPLTGGAYPTWRLIYEDGDDNDFNDLIMTVTALPPAP